MRHLDVAEIFQIVPAVLTWLPVRRIKIWDSSYVTKARPRNFVLHCRRLRLFDPVAGSLLLPARMQGTG